MAFNQANHKIVFIKILKDIYTYPSIGPVLGFKGGTAAYLFYNLDRFSVDLDFDLLDTTKENLVFEKLKGILEKYGRLKIADIKRYSLIFILSYEEKEPGSQNVKIEVNKRNFGSQYSIKSYLGISMKVMTRDDMAANKLVALYERMGKTNRDIYDSWYFLSNNWPINRELVEKRTGMPFKDFLERCCELMEKMDNKGILSGIGELLDEKQKAWVRKNLKDELLFQLRLYIKTYLDK